MQGFPAGAPQPVQGTCRIAVSVMSTTTTPDRDISRAGCPQMTPAGHGVMVDGDQPVAVRALWVVRVAQRVEADPRVAGGVAAYVVPAAVGAGF